MRLKYDGDTNVKSKKSLPSSLIQSLAAEIERVVSKKVDESIIRKLDVIEQEIKEVRQKDIPGIKVDVAVVKTQSASSAKVISAVGGLIAVATSIAIAYFK